MRRPSDFARLYDLTERVIPERVLAMPAPGEHDARKNLLELAARHHGIGTVEDLADYHRQKAVRSRPLIAELVEEGRLIPTTVEGWTKPAYLHPLAARPRRVVGASAAQPVRSRGVVP